MTRQASRVLVAFAFAVAAAAAVWFRYPGRAPVSLNPALCDPRLWDHVHDRSRLRVVQACTAVDGRVISVHRYADGDLHILLAPDRKSAVNVINLIRARGALVLEAICEHTPTESRSQAACGDYRSAIAAPALGDRIRVTGAYVIDGDRGWVEIHPITRIEMLPY